MYNDIVLKGENMSVNVRYEVLDNNTVGVFYGDSTVPSLRQPHWPNGDAWADAAEAEAWAKLYVASVTDEKAPYAPDARGKQGAAKPTPEEIAKMKAEIEAKNPNPKKPIEANNSNPKNPTA